MKSGAKIHLKVLASQDPAEAVRQLKNGSLRSLLIHLAHPNPASTTRLHGEAMVEAANRWVKKGRAVL